MTNAIAKKDTAVSFEGWKETRKNFIENIQTIMVAGKDYHDLNFRGKEVRVLAKGGAEKVASAFGWVASFSKDTETVEMLGTEKGLVAFLCKLTDKTGKVIGEGRGARSIKQDQGDANKTIKMAQKSAFIDAVLRTSGLSDLFTQDIEDMKEEPAITHVERVIDIEEKPAPVTEKKQIAQLLAKLNCLKGTAKESDAEVLRLTQIEMKRENYPEIIARLTVMVNENA